jgi:hypothetical protein
MRTMSLDDIKVKSLIDEVKYTQKLILNFTKNFVNLSLREKELYVKIEEHMPMIQTRPIYNRWHGIYTMLVNNSLEIIEKFKYIDVLKSEILSYKLFDEDKFNKIIKYTQFFNKFKMKFQKKSRRKKRKQPRRKLLKRKL